MVKRKVVWSEKAIDDLNYYCGEISRESFSAAKKVRSVILATAKELSNFPYIYQVEEYFLGNTGDVRRFFCWSYRVVYQVQEKKVVILSVIHTRMNPEKISS